MNAPKTTLLLAIALLAPATAWGVASEWSKNPQSSARLITPWQVAPRSGELFLGLHFRLSPGWHIYWKNSGDAGFPPTVALQPAAALGKGEILWPTPRRFHLPGDLVAFGYETEVVYPVRTILQAGGETLHLVADLDYVICEVDCIPYRYTLTLDQPVGDQPASDPETRSLLQSWLDRLPRLPEEVPGLGIGAALDASRPGQPPMLEVRLLGVTGQAGQTDVFLETHEAFDAGAPRIRVFPDRVNLHLPLEPREAGRRLPEKMTFAWTVSNLSTMDGKGFDLEVRQEIPVWTEPAENRDAGGQAAPPDRLPRLLLWAFLGGLLLNLTPTVLPLLAAEALVLRGSGTGVREGSAAAATGVVGACWALAGLALAGQRTGVPVGWGAALQEPPLGALLAVLSALLALNLWGQLEAPLAPAGSTSQGTGRHLLVGLFTGPLALAWPVPLLQEPVGYAFGRGPVAVAAVYAVVGFGLALPYLILTLAPAAARLLPNPGPWAARLREGLGFLTAASTFWLLYALSRQVSPEGLAWIELALLGMALLAWLRSREGAGRPLRLALVLGLAACGAGALWLAERNRLSPGTGAVVTRETASEGLLPIRGEPTPNQTSGG